VSAPTRARKLSKRFATPPRVHRQAALPGGP
jgi:hypothetical protein